MSIFTTSAQIAQDYDVSHQDVLDTINNLPYEDLRETHISVLDLPDLVIAQLTETGANAVIFHLPDNNANRVKLTKFRETLFQSRHSHISGGAMSQSNAPGLMSSSESSSLAQIDPQIRERVKQEIAAGKWDDHLTESITSFHRMILAEYGGDPGYQNCRVYITNRRKVANIAA